MASASNWRFDIVRAETAAQFDIARTLFREYAATLETGFCLAGFEHELQDLSSMYAAPGGALLIAISHDAGCAFGCAGIRRFDATHAELKRVYVQPHARNIGAGRALTEAAMAHARALGYGHLLLDTLDSMAPAQALYRSLGFKECGAFRNKSAADRDTHELRYFSRPL